MKMVLFAALPNVTAVVEGVVSIRLPPFSPVFAFAAEVEMLPAAEAMTVPWTMLKAEVVAVPFQVLVPPSTSVPLPTFVIPKVDAAVVVRTPLSSKVFPAATSIAPPVPAALVVKLRCVAKLSVTRSTPALAVAAVAPEKVTAPFVTVSPRFAFALTSTRPVLTVNALKLLLPFKIRRPSPIFVSVAPAMLEPTAWVIVRADPTLMLLAARTVTSLFNV